MTDTACPACGSDDIYHHQDYTAVAYVDHVSDDGCIELGATKDDIPHSTTSKLVCESCGWEGSVRDYLQP